MITLLKEHGVVYEVQYNEHLNMKFWYQNGQKHREEGPAVECIAEDHSSCPKNFVIYRWFKNGNPHREDGPTEVSHSGKLLYALNGKKFYSRKQFLLEQKDKIVYINGQPHLIDGRPVREC